MSDEYLDITPETNFLNMIRADRSGTWPTLLAEAVDNSLDAGATEIAIALSEHSASIADNGCGISRSREKAIVTLGRHGEMASTRLGRFGVGIKYNAANAGDLLEVESVSVDGHMLLSADWDKVIRSGRWQILKPKWRPSLATHGSGTTITISELRWPSPKEKDVISVRDYLAQTFYPALEYDGVSIRLNGSPVNLLREPDMSDVVEQTIQLANGKGAHVRGGILIRRDDQSHWGVQVSYKHRVIMPKSNFGCDGFSGTRGMFARVRLTADWALTRFKDDIDIKDAADRDELEKSVLEILTPILEKCHTAHMDLKVEEMTDRLNDLLPFETRATRPPRKKSKRDKPTHRKNGKPDGRHGRSDRDASKTGPTRTQCPPADRLIVVFDGPLCEEHGYGLFTKGRPNRITLARDNPDIAALLEQRDKHLAARSLLGLALMIYEHAKLTEPGQTSLPFDKSSFGLRVWRTAVRQSSDEKKEQAS